MGQAKKRGTFEERREQSKQREHQKYVAYRLRDMERQKQIQEEWNALKEEEREAKRVAARQAMTSPSKVAAMLAMAIAARYPVRGRFEGH